MTKCDDQDVDAPRVGCGCRECYHVREAYLDLGLREIAHWRGALSTIRTSQDIVHRTVVHYLGGRIEHAVLHVTIIKALMELADRQSEHLMSLVNLQAPFVVLPDKKP